MPLHAIGEEIWIAEGPAVSFYGFPYPTRMAVIRLEDGALWLWSPIELDEDLVVELQKLGPVRHLVSPNKLHHLFLGKWSQRCPQARLYAPPGLVRKRRDLHFDAQLGDTPEAAWKGQIDQILIGGSWAMNELMFFHRRSSTCLVGDLIQRHPPSQTKGWKGWIMRLDGLVGPQGSTPREWRWTFLHRSEARGALERALAWKPRQVVIAHGQCARTGGTEVLRNNLSWLKPK